METIRTVLTIAEMNKLNVCAADAGNAFLCGRTREKVCVIAGPEFGLDEGKRMIVEKGLCGLRTSGARFHETLAAVLRNMGFKPSKADDDLWIRPQTDPEIGDHCECVATCVDDLLAFSRDPGPIVQQMQQHLTRLRSGLFNQLLVNAVVVTVDHHRGSEENQPGWEYHDPSLVDPNRKGVVDVSGTVRFG